MHFLIKFKCLTCLIFRARRFSPGLTCLYKGARLYLGRLFNVFINLR